MSTAKATRIALAGFGAWGQMHARAVAGISGAEIGAVLCRSEAAQSKAREMLPQAARYTDYVTMLAEADCGVVDITVPNHLHAEFAVAALASDRHVFLEKPIGLDLTSCAAVVAAAQRSGRKVAVNHELRVSHQWGAVRRFAEEGALGKIRYQHFCLFRHPFRHGSGGWRYDRQMVGSWVLEELVHFFDLILWYGRENGLPKTVFAAGTEIAGGHFDNLAATLTWADGSVAQINQCLSGFQHHALLEVSGSDGSLRTWWSGAMDRTEHPDFAMLVERRGGDGVETWPIEKSGEIFELKANLEKAFEAFGNGATDYLGPQEASQAIAVCLATEKSAASGAVTDIDYGDKP
ncbi:MAG: Gfo/Idh/MocA family protein [Alphaproteobacteria bacterium]